jgi:hypothetical protein
LFRQVVLRAHWPDHASTAPGYLELRRSGGAVLSEAALDGIEEGK